jgi:hypothetical protein
MPAGLLLLVACAATTFDSSYDGTIGGVVVNRSRADEPVAGTKVVLQMKSDGPFALLDETTTDAAGRFLFRNLLVSQYVEYKTSAHYEGIHYPGPRVRLTSGQDAAAATLAVRDVVHEPNPLRVRDHEISIRSATGVLEVTESLLVENPSDRTYVGPEPGNAEEQPVTLQLSIPSDFQKVTFHQEFFGRSFSVRDGKLVTTLPWEPGQRALKFTYFIHNTQQRRLWERTVDLPTDELRVRIATTAPDDVSSNLEPQGATRRAGYTEVRFTSGPNSLPAQHVVRCEMGKLPVPWTYYGKWVAALVLGALIACGSLASRRRRATAPPATGQDPVLAGSRPAHTVPQPNRKRTTRRNLRRAA